MTPQEALDRIAALCDRHLDPHLGSASYYMAEQVRAVLAEVFPEAEPHSRFTDDVPLVRVSPEVGGVLDRDQARNLVRQIASNPSGKEFPDGWVDALAAAVRPVEFTVDPELLDRHAVELEARTRLPLGYARESLMRLVNVLIPAVRPVAGVTLTPSEAADLALVLRQGTDVLLDSDRGPRLRGVMRRLEEAYR